ncbi:type II secretion system F family protein [Pontimicrobium aquaticum]|uniref:General secretion pathway protein F n=1 Tax=Pontimicrobium aquaticum TaxID=2565367 RepID=A0A4U0EZB7_9FLAO|nr:type II secretion system F family protein [Pontimicrobium aquaticum]TJY37393.1 type II secretion system F family protein [Pontimicrobium aquaticum]
MAFNLEKTYNAPTTKKLSKAKQESFLQKEISLFNKPFSPKIKEQFYLELSVLLKAGITLKKALELIKDSQKKKANASIVEQISKAIISGKSLSDAIQPYKQFSNYEYHSLKIGEETGTLAQVTAQLGEFYAKKNEQKRQLISALTYPIIILTTAALVVVFMLNFVVPMFQDLFKQQQIELPYITVIIIKASNVLKDYGWLILLMVAVLITIRLLLKNKTWYKQHKDGVILKLPLVGSFIKTVYLSQFTQAVALLTASKVPLVNSIQLVKQMITFYPLEKALIKIEEDILVGDSLSEALSKHKLFDEKMIALVKVAEETNQTEFVFKKLNEQYNTLVQQRSKVMATLLEPIIILFVGFAVGVILIAMYLPMFKLSSVLG